MWVFTYFFPRKWKIVQSGWLLAQTCFEVNVYVHLNCRNIQRIRKSRKIQSHLMNLKRLIHMCCDVTVLERTEKMSLNEKCSIGNVFRHLTKIFRYSLYGYIKWEMCILAFFLWCNVVRSLKFKWMNSVLERKKNPIESHKIHLNWSSFFVVRSSNFHFISFLYSRISKTHFRSWKSFYFFQSLWLRGIDRTFIDTKENIGLLYQAFK